MKNIQAGSPTMMKAIHAVNRSVPPTMHRVFDKTYVVVTPELGALLYLLYPDYDFEIQHGIQADDGEPK